MSLTVLMGPDKARFSPVGSSEVRPSTTALGGTGSRTAGRGSGGNERNRIVAQEVLRQVALVVGVNVLVRLNAGRSRARPSRRRQANALDLANADAARCTGVPAVTPGA